MLNFSLPNDLWLRSRVLDKEIFMSLERRLTYVRNKSLTYILNFTLCIAIVALTDLG